MAVKTPRCPHAAPAISELGERPLQKPSSHFAFSRGSVSRIPRVALLLVPGAMTAGTKFSCTVQRGGD
ncbi:hypothetical protein MUK42_21241 [Musa troglodytarum]|uniref:Uncharacterized protein n=1 Tax=Musa troglodytarum TaxID=320322 RepID=A0A9E7K593_9LILI|nr:hypothetical protein MUK42_21241 [Musa troglodytarum]